MSELSDEELDKRLEAVLAQHNASNCPACGRKIDRGDLAWNSASTEAGTDYSIVSIACLNCFTEVAYVTSWMCCVADLEDVLDILEDDWY